MEIDRLFDKKLRQTGRTTRMLEKAKKLAQEGRAVYIIAANEAERRRIYTLLGSNDLVIRVEAPDMAGSFQWETMSFAGAHPNCIFLVDHFAVEIEILRRLHGLGPVIRSLISDQEQEKATRSGTAFALVREYGQALVSKKIYTEPMGDYPGGIATVARVESLPCDTDIIMDVLLPNSEWERDPIGVFDYELVRLVEDI